MTYIATLTLDYTGGNTNEQTRLTNALCQAGWEYVETSALAYQADHLDGVRLALEVLARAVETPGTLSALAIQVQLIGATRLPPAEQSHRRALRNLLSAPLRPSTCDPALEIESVCHAHGTGLTGSLPRSWVLIASHGACIRVRGGWVPRPLPATGSVASWPVPSVAQVEAAGRLIGNDHRARPIHYYQSPGRQPRAARRRSA